MTGILEGAGARADAPEVVRCGSCGRGLVPAPTPIRTIAGGGVLLLLGGALAAADPPPSLLGEWVLAGQINLDTKLVTPAADELRIELRRDVVITTSHGHHQAVYCSWSVDAQGITIHAEQNGASAIYAPLLIMADGIVLRFQDFRDCMLLKRADGKPPGLAPSAWPKPLAAPATPPGKMMPMTAGDFTVHAQQLNMSRMMQYPESPTQAVSGSEDVRLSIFLKPLVKATIVAVKRALVEEAVTDNGENLRLPPVTDPLAAAEPEEGQVLNHSDTWFQFRLRLPTSGAKELKHFRGSVTVGYETTVRAPFDLPLPRSLIGKRELIADTGLGLTITSITPDKVTWSADAGLEPLVKAYQFLDAAGRTIDSSGSSASGPGQNKTIEQSFDLRLPDDGAIRVRLYGAVAEVTVPIVLEHLALVPPSPPPADPIRKF